MRVLKFQFSSLVALPLLPLAKPVAIFFLQLWFVSPACYHWSVCLAARTSLVG